MLSGTSAGRTLTNRPSSSRRAEPSRRRVGGRIGLGVAQLLGLGQNDVERRAVLLNLGQDVVAGAVEDTEQGLNAVGADALAQHRVNRNAAANRGLEAQAHAALGGAPPDVETVQRDQFLVGRDDAFPVGDGALHHLPRHARTADQLDHDVDARARHHVAPMLGDEGVRHAGGHGAPQCGAAANRCQVQPEAQPGGDFVGVFRENSDCSTPDVAEAHDANIDVPHKAS